MTQNQTSRSWSARVDIDPETGDQVIVFDPVMLKELDWKEGDTIDFDVEEGVIVLRKVE